MTPARKDRLLITKRKREKEEGAIENKAAYASQLQNLKTPALRHRRTPAPDFSRTQKSGTDPAPLFELYLNI
jgi:hypothetical protein